jgi:hypothetical protein
LTAVLVSTRISAAGRLGVKIDQVVTVKRSVADDGADRLPRLQLSAAGELEIVSEFSGNGEQFGKAELPGEYFGEVGDLFSLRASAAAQEDPAEQF